jgi:hypothetical protein
MYEKFVALAFALLATAQPEEYYLDSYGAYYDQTPEPIVEDIEWTYLTVPDDFGEFVNNIEFLGVSLFFDGEDSEIFGWAVSNYVANSDFAEPTGYVFAAAVGYLDTVSDEELMYLCFDHTNFDLARCAITRGN